MTEETFQVTGLTCSHCQSAVAAELREVAGVDDVVVDLVPGGVSTVRVSSGEPLRREQIVAALDEAGDYRLVEGDG